MPTKCKTCGVFIPGPNGAQSYASPDISGVQCEPCAVQDYKAKHPFGDIPLLKIPEIMRINTKDMA